MGYYTGIKVCAGCKKSGKEKPRFEADSLCEECKTALKKGYNLINDENESYIRVRQHHHALPDGQCNVLLHELLSGINRQEKDSIGMEHIYYSTGDNCSYYKITNKAFKALQGLIIRYNELIRESLLKGKEKGSSLLFQLNNGEINMSDFEKLKKQ